MGPTIVQVAKRSTFASDQLMGGQPMRAVAKGRTPVAAAKGGQPYLDLVKRFDSSSFNIGPFQPENATTPTEAVKVKPQAAAEAAHLPSAEESHNAAPDCPSQFEAHLDSKIDRHPPRRLEAKLRGRKSRAARWARQSQGYIGADPGG
ncbi:hypothetical protein LA080_006274 [Diaporthe eres]|nr:hypothetical protein LA080_006274 [Diaporthe eres]